MTTYCLPLPPTCSSPVAVGTMSEGCNTWELRYMENVWDMWHPTHLLMWVTVCHLPFGRGRKQEVDTWTGKYSHHTSKTWLGIQTPQCVQWLPLLARNFYPSYTYPKPIALHMLPLSHTPVYRLWIGVWAVTWFIHLSSSILFSTWILHFLKKKIMLSLLMKMCYPPPRGRFNLLASPLPSC